MLEKLSVRTFKSLEDVQVELGLVNVFIGANGSGKTNLLEALGVLSAAADGKVDDQTVLNRGVRPGLPALYKSAFPARTGRRIPPHLFFGAEGGRASYEVALHNPLDKPEPAWRFKTELWEDRSGTLVGYSPAQRRRHNPERGLAALKAAEISTGAAPHLLKTLQDYVIYSPATDVLRGVIPETRPRRPVGLFGGNLPQALRELLRLSRINRKTRRVIRDVLGLIDWAEGIDSIPANELRLSPSAATSRRVIGFRDRYMRKGRNILSAYDASEGALYAIFLAVIAAHEKSPALCAIDNADHGLNPRMARALIERLCHWYLDADTPRQVLLTTHNPLVLDGLPLQKDKIRLFTVSRTNSGRTTVRRVKIDKALLNKAQEGWSLSRLWVMGHLGGVPDV